MKFVFILGTLLLSQSVHAALVMNVQGIVTAQYEIDENNIADEITRSFKGSGAIDGNLFGEKIKRTEAIQKDLEPTTQFVASNKSDEKFEIRAAGKHFASAAKEILTPYVAMNRRESLQSKVEYRLEDSKCERFAQSIICETRLWARLQGRH